MKNESSRAEGRTAPATGGALAPAADALSKAGRFAGRFRWVICALLFLGVTKNYMDRQVLSVLKIPLQHQFGWDDTDYGNIVAAFQVAYAVGMLVMGRLVDRLGARIGYAAVMVFWSVASMAHAAAGSLGGFIGARVALGFGEAGVFPASIKSVAEWFPRKERALATGIFNAGTSLGAMITPLLIPWIVERLGWHWAFVITGSLGFAWLALWLVWYRKPEEHPSCTPEELALIQSDPIASPGKIGWLKLLPHRQTYVVAAAKFLTDPVWWFFLFWTPDYLQRAHGLRLSGIGLPLATIYLISDAGSVAGGWMSSTLIRRGVSVNAARKLTMLVCALCVLPIAVLYRVSALWPATLLIGLAAAAHQGFSANVYTLSSDLFPSRAVGSVIGLGGMAGAIGGIILSEVAGRELQRTNSYAIPFLIAASAYLVALACVHVLSPKLRPAQLAVD
jgi:ACS family hexuronate transporter-like MFS transporter